MDPDADHSGATHRSLPAGGRAIGFRRGEIQPGARACREADRGLGFSRGRASPDEGAIRRSGPGCAAGRAAGRGATPGGLEGAAHRKHQVGRSAAKERKDRPPRHWRAGDRRGRAGDCGHAQQRGRGETPLAGIRRRGDTKVDAENQAAAGTLARRDGRHEGRRLRGGRTAGPGLPRGIVGRAVLWEGRVARREDRPVPPAAGRSPFRPGPETARRRQTG